MQTSRSDQNYSSSQAKIPPVDKRPYYIWIIVILANVLAFLLRTIYLGNDIPFFVEILNIMSGFMFLAATIIPLWLSGLKSKWRHWFGFGIPILILLPVPNLLWSGINCNNTSSWCFEWLIIYPLISLAILFSLFYLIGIYFRKWNPKAALSLVIVTVTLFFLSVYGIYVTHKEAINDPYYVDTSTFVKLEGGYYSRDKNSVQYVGTKIDNADLATFVVIEGVYAKDQYSVYYSGNKLINVDLATFMVLGANYSKDANSVYYASNLLDNADPATFEILQLEKYDPKVTNTIYSKDKNSVYYGGDKLDGSDPATFEILRDFYSKDKNSVYYQNSKIDNIHAATFELLEFGYFKDTNAVYIIQMTPVRQIDNADPATFEIISYTYTKDKNSVYRNGYIIPNTDPATFDPSQF